MPSNKVISSKVAKVLSWCRVIHSVPFTFWRVVRRAENMYSNFEGWNKCGFISIVRRQYFHRENKLAIGHSVLQSNALQMPKRQSQWTQPCQLSTTQLNAYGSLILKWGETTQTAPPPMFLCLGLVFSTGDYLCFLLARSLHSDEGPGPELAQKKSICFAFQ